MPNDIPLKELIRMLHEEHNFSDGSVSLLADKGFEQKEFGRLYEAMSLPDQTFAERRKNASWLQKLIGDGDSEEITTGRYNKYVDNFKDISSEQALVRGRMKFAVEYVIALADLLSGYPEYGKLVEKPFSDEEKEKLRSIYKSFRTKDFAAARIIEDKTNHDIVAANTWVTIMAQQLGLDDNLMRAITHLARTSSDVNTNVTGELYTRAIGQWTSSVATLISSLEKRARDYAETTCVAETHGQDAQLTSLGHIYANLAEQVRLHAEPLLKKEKLKLDGKIAGAIGTDVDMKAAFPNVDPTQMYRSIVENTFGLRYVELGNDQDCSNAALAQALDTMVNVGMVIKKAATDTWIYASRDILAKATKKGESGSSAMPQKTNPFLAEGAEALTSIYSGMVNPIKEMIVAYREQGDLRRSITLREGFHPIMLAVVAVERLNSELKNYEPNIIALEDEIYRAGPKIISSAINTYLRGKGMPDAYDRIKDVVMKPYVNADEVKSFIGDAEKTIGYGTARKLEEMLYSVMDTEGCMKKLEKASSPDEQKALIGRLTATNRNETRRELLGTAVNDTYRMADRAKETRELLLRYN
ncbi:MAG: lyase family protein [Candidatus Aenigmatarchaeota archaeon]